MRQNSAEQFYLFRNGPLYRLLQRLHLGDSPPKVFIRRVIVLTAVSWLPLLVLSFFGAGAGSLSFLEDIEVHARFLVALPILVYGEAWINSQTALVVEQFLKSGIVPPATTPAFQALVQRIKRVSNSIWGEGAVLALTLFVLRPAWFEAAKWRGFSWFAEWQGGGLQLSPAGYFLTYFSMPLFQFILFRWVYRLVVWALFLRKVSRLDLAINALHPDDMGGLNFLSESVRAMAPVLLTLSALASGTITMHILYDGKDLLFYQIDLALIGALALILSFGPLLTFCGPMREARLRALREYGVFASEYVRRFADKWVVKEGPQEELLGCGDIQSLADLANSYNVVEAMKFAPFKLRDMITVLACTYILVAPLLLTVVPAEQLLKSVLAILL